MNKKSNLDAAGAVLVDAQPEHAQHLHVLQTSVTAGSQGDLLLHHHVDGLLVLGRGGRLGHLNHREASKRCVKYIAKKRYTYTCM